MRRAVAVFLVVVVGALTGCGVTAQDEPQPLSTTSHNPVPTPTVTQLPEPTPTTAPSSTPSPAPTATTAG
ncbi:hypothetical protein [Saccharothrix longispora]|uniref:hypothetical protein n=1 Tax=Saccharothrix longispora TaxID=33920 RepID=UPI0028FD1DFF|nr:hypothetical protein [Saccharothrix longispora]MBY8851725.1 hypothetical protein [Saccharothrix sp. MB29]MDU0287976.1 hypothetical protein [Saccharothrix longispora]